jgi:hypothetical protein
MMDASKEFATYMKAAAGEFHGPLGSCPEEAELIAYQQGSLAGERREQIQAHLIGCRGCRDTLLEAADFFEPERPGEQALSPAELQRDWTPLWRRLRGEPPSWFAFWRWPKQAWALGAPLAAAAGFALMWGIGLQQDVQSLEREIAGLRERLVAGQRSHEALTAKLRAPRINVTVQDIFTRESLTRSGGQGGLNRVRLGAEPAFTLILNAQGVPVAPSYSFEIVRSSGEVLWSHPGLKRDAHGNFSLTMDKDFLPAAEYRFRIRSDDADRRLITEYVLVVEPTAPSR